MTNASGIDLDGLNSLAAGDAHRVLLNVCAAPQWARGMTAARPFQSVEALLSTADRVLTALTEADLDHALAGHPRLGERSVADEVSGSEQSGVHDADRAGLLRGNREYEERFGHVYVACATGRSGQELLKMLHERLANDPATERRVIREELGKINRLRLQRLIAA